mmetsp:Transcript_8447/g.27667  ORF Transcript_8447/g.27667 Transcript_8447/m.27667 type:complete len:269 (-) Transcript_8447:88-894(-)
MGRRTPPGDGLRGQDGVPLGHARRQEEAQVDGAHVLRERRRGDEGTERPRRLGRGRRPLNRLGPAVQGTSRGNPPRPRRHGRRDQRRHPRLLRRHRRRRTRLGPPEIHDDGGDVIKNDDGPRESAPLQPRGPPAYDHGRRPLAGRHDVAVERHGLEAFHLGRPELRRRRPPDAPPRLRRRAPRLPEKPPLLRLVQRRLEGLRGFLGLHRPYLGRRLRRRTLLPPGTPRLRQRRPLPSPRTHRRLLRLRQPHLPRRNRSLAIRKRQSWS